MYIDFIWTQEIFGIIASTQDDEMVEKVEKQIIDNHETVEMVQMVDKWLFLMIACTNNDVLMFVVVAVVNRDTWDVQVVDERVEVIDVHEMIDEQFSDPSIIHTSQISHLQMTMWMKQFWFHGKIHTSNKVHRTNGKTQWSVFRRQITPQQ